ncbi:glycosyltransferase [Gloeocapsopsis sp. IPPAS B-1203]|uniref:glycosyltransferase n=1 Tax=Gloeocapsopsis sp. IPPAS B-1203 TaxID=2049454 RepID=UPI000C1886AC|nr:glycosyltransferase [Gloeocapsopsis sp. IPPAS B-1203]PIG94119.1 glycosyl transferase [Gloeocapsopsis sp. IPPAS B-1203]
MHKNQTHVAFYIYQLHGGGAERVLVNLMQYFIRQGLKIDLVLNSVTGPYLPQVPSEVRIVDLNAPKPFRHGIPQLMRYLRNEKPSIMVVSLHPCIEAALVAKLLTFSSTQIVVREDSNLSLDAKMSTGRVHRAPLFAKLLYPWAHKIIAVSQGVAADLVQITGMPKKRIEVIYNPIVTPNLGKKSQESVEHSWFKPGEPPVIIGVGRLVPQKDFPMLIQAFAQVRKVRPCRLMILGQGSEQQNLNNLIAKLGLENDVTMLGFVQNPYSYMAKAKVLALSSAWEGFGNVIVEAMAVGTPVISTDCQSGPAEVLANGKYGWLVPVGDSKAMAEAILSVLSGSSKPVDAGWLDQFNLESVCQKYLDTLRIPKFVFEAGVAK